jgi:hypothetical protein
MQEPTLESTYPALLVHFKEVEDATILAKRDYVDCTRDQYCLPRRLEHALELYKTLKHEYSKVRKVLYDYEDELGFYSSYEDSLVEEDEEESAEEEVQYIRPSEIHPFKTEVGLVGGGKKRGPRKRKPKKAKKKLDCVPYVRETNKRADIAPPFRFVKLTYNDEGTVIQGATPFKIVSYQATTAYDVYSGILTTSLAGFEENANFYDQFRVHMNEIVWDVTNNEANVAVRVALCLTTFSAQANVTTFQGAVDLTEGPYSTKLVTLSRANGGSDREKLAYTMLPQKLLGDNTYFTDLQYAGTFNSNPAIMLYVNLVVVSVGNTTNLTNGVIGNLSMRETVKFWNRRLIIDPTYATHTPPKPPIVQPVPQTQESRRRLTEAKDPPLVPERESAYEEVVIRRKVL